jgi:hypothetical protein
MHSWGTMRAACFEAGDGVKRARGQAMTFDEVLDQIRQLLQQRGRMTYRSLQLRYQLDDELLTGVTDELIKAERVAADENGEVLVWVGTGTEEETEKWRNGEAEKIGLESSVQSLESGGQGRTSPAQTLD